MEAPVSFRPRQTLKSAYSSYVACSAEKTSKRQISSAAASERLTVQPPVCRVHPGRALELQTRLGLMRAKQALQGHSQLNEPAKDVILKTQEKTPTQLKAASLQPLGIVDDCLISPLLCLGIIPANTHRNRKYQCPRSSTVPGEHLLHHTNNSTTSDNKRVKERQRSQSAILKKTINTRHLTKLLSVSKQTGFLPQGEDNANDHYSFTPERTEPKYNSLKRPTDTQEKVKMLSPVVRYGKLEMMKVEVKRLQNNDTIKAEEDIFGSSSEQRTGTPKCSPTTFAPITETDLGGTTSKQSPNLEHPENIKQKLNSFDPKAKNKLENPVEKQYLIGASHKHPETNNGTKKSSDNVRVRVVSIGEVTTMNGKPKTKNTRQRRSSGHLSLGWSPPQPLEPITGSTITTPTRPPVTENKGNEDEVATEKKEKKSALTTSMTIRLDVNDFLDSIESVHILS